MTSKAKLRPVTEGGKVVTRRQLQGVLDQFAPQIAQAIDAGIAARLGDVEARLSKLERPWWKVWA